MKEPDELQTANKNTIIQMYRQLEAEVERLEKKVSKELTPQEVDELKKERRALRNEVKRLRKELNRWEKFYFVIQTASLSIERR